MVGMYTTFTGGPLARTSHILKYLSHPKKVNTVTINTRKTFSNILANVIILLITLLLSLFNDNIYSILFGGATVNVETLLTLSWVISAVYLVINTILYFVTNKIFNKGVKIE